MPEHILSLSYGKDSMACFGACELLGWPIDRVVTAEVWATDTIPADLPPMVEFKKKADRIIKERWGIEVEHVFRICSSKKVTYNSVFYKNRTIKSNNPGKIYGWPTSAYKGVWCTGELKQNILKATQKGSVVYLGIASDEPNRFHNLSERKKSPLWKLDGRNLCAVNGAKKTTCFHRSTQPQPVAVAGSATTRAWDSSGACARTTQNCGRLC